MTAWVDSRMISVDLETTSPDPQTARMVTAAVAFVGGDEDTHTTVILADPGVEIPEGATAIHGVTTEHARAHGLPSRTAVARVLAALHQRPAGAVVVCMNARFDLTVLEREAERHMLTPPSALGLHVVDVRVIDLHLDRYRRGPRKLADLCAHYGARIDQAHDAAFDAVAAARVAWVIGTKADVVRRGDGHDEVRELLVLRREWDRVRHDPPALHDAQARWAAVQARGLAEHFARNGQPQTVPEEWPVLPAADQNAERASVGATPPRSRAWPQPQTTP